MKAKTTRGVPLILIIFVVSCVTCFRIASAAQPAATQPFLIGVDYPADANPQIKALFDETGCNFVRITGGGYGWATKAHKAAVDDLQKRGVKVLIQLGSHWPSADYFPMTGDYFVDQKGGTGKEDRTSWSIKYGTDSWPQFSYSAGAEFRAKMEKDFTDYLSAFKDNTNIVGVILHNEPGFFWNSERLYDYNPHTIARFREWLKVKHGTIETLNKRWGTSETSFDTIDPPRDVPTKNVGGMLDWRRFNIDLMEEFLTWESNFAKKAWPGLPRMTNTAGAINNWFFYRCDDNYQLTKPFDIAGVDIYPSEWHHRLYPDYAMALTAGVAGDRPTWVLECQVYDDIHKSLTPEQRGDLLYRDLWTYIGRGAKAISIWRMTGDEGHALTHGEFNPRVRALRDVAYQAKMLHLERFIRPARNVALVVDPDTFLLAGATDEKPLTGSSSVSEDAQGLYAAIVENQIDCDVLFTQQIRDGAWKNYKGIVMAQSPMMDEELAKALTEFVESGGTLIAEAPFAEMDRWGGKVNAIPSFGLDRLFGIETDLFGARKYLGIQNDTSTMVGQGGRAKITKVDGAKVIGKFVAVAKDEPDDDIAVTFQKSGKGNALFISTPVGLPYLQGWGEQGLRELLGNELKGASGMPSVSAESTDPSTNSALSMLEDDRGNRLIIVTLSNDKQLPLAAVPQLKYVLSNFTGLPETFYTAGSKGVSYGKVRPGAIEGTHSIEINWVNSATAILLPKDFELLPQIELSRTEFSAGKKVDVTLSVYNPCPRARKMTLDLKLPEGAESKTVTWSADIEPNAAFYITIPVKAIKVGRQTVRAVVRYDEDGQTFEVEGIPVDFEAK